MSKLSTRNENRHNAIINNFVSCKHGKVVGAVLSRAQLCYQYTIQYTVYSIQYTVYRHEAEL